MAITIKVKSTIVAKEKWLELTKLLSTSKVNCAKVMPIKDGYIVACNSDEDVEKLFSAETIQALETKSFHPIVPQTVKAKKTVIVKNIDSYLCDFDCESLISSINEINSPWLKICSLFKFQSGKTFKMECETQQMARLCTERGFFILNLSIPPRMLSIDEYIKVDFCYKCYSINEHFVQDCPKEHDYKVCSECTSVNHTYRDCASTSKKCINCSGNHSTMSQRCPKIKQTKVKNVPKPSQVTVQKSIFNQSQSSPPTKLQTLSRDDMFRGYMCIMYATKLNETNPNSFDENLSQLLLANNLPSFSTGGLVPQCGDTLNNTCVLDTIIEQKTEDVIVNASEIDSSVEKIDDVSSVAEHTAEESIAGSSGTQLTGVKQKRTVKESNNFANKPVCIIYLKKGKGPITGNKFNELRESKNIFIEHYCPNEKNCIASTSNGLHRGITDGLQICELSARSYETKFKNVVSK